jgi:hypothetical protein
MAGGSYRKNPNLSLKMALSFDEIRKQIKEQRKRATINRAVLHQNRIRFHAQTSLTANLCQPTSDFLSFVSNLIPHDKFKIFKTLFRYPVKTNEVTGICFDKLSRIFDGRNPAFNYQFMNTEQRDDWEYYRVNVLHEPDIWATKGWEFFKSEINSVLIVDLPTEQKAGETYPAPYFYWLPIESVIAFEANRTSGVMDWIIFRQDGGRIAVIDEERYRVFREEKGGNIGELLVDNPHDLGYCPARFFWNEAISLREPDVKASPLTKELESLDWYLFYHLSKRHLDLYGAYPIYSGYEQACDFSNSENGDYCDGGFLKDRQGFYRYDSAGLLMRCPKCGEKRIVGVGSFVEVPIPGENQPDLRNPVQMLTVDRASLDYNVAEEERLRNAIITSVVGTNEEITTRDALNEQQIRANFESQSTVLNRVKKGFEAAQQFVDETVCRLRYGTMFVSAKINMGTDFYVFDAAELRNRYKVARESGASEAELDALHNQILETEYRNDPTQLQRMLTLAELEPYRHMTRDEVLNLSDKGIISATDMRIKLNFNNFVRRFERENTNILEFGANIPFQRKIEIINQRFAEYANESINNI